MNHVMIIERGTPVPKVSGRGRKRGTGPNQKILKSMSIGDSIWNVTEQKMLSFRHTSKMMGIRLKVRKIPDTNLYAIERVGDVKGI